MIFLDITASAVPCPAAAPEEAPMQYIDAYGALRLSNGTDALCLYPSGQFATCSLLSHDTWWNPETCTAATSGVTLRPRPLTDGPDDIASACRTGMVARLDTIPPGQWRDAVAQEVIEAGGTFPLLHDAQQDQLAELSLYGIVAHGTCTDAAIADWIGRARIGLRPAPPAFHPADTRPRNHGEEIAALIRQRDSEADEATVHERNDA